MRPAIAGLWHKKGSPAFQEKIPAGHANEPIMVLEMLAVDRAVTLFRMHDCLLNVMTDSAVVHWAIRKRWCRNASPQRARKL